MSPATQKVVKWPLLFILFTFVVACTGKQQPTVQESSVTTDQKPSISPEKALESPGTQALDVARKMLGSPYRYGGTDPKGFDCSGLTMVCYRLNGLNLPRVSRNQFQAGRWVPKAQLRPGDLVFFATKGGQRVTHVGMYIGEGKFIHAPRTGKNVRIEKLSNSFFTKTFMGGRSYL